MHSGKRGYGQYGYPITEEVWVMWSNNPRDWKPINHSCNPNAWLDNLNLVARRCIPRGEQITVDYATFYHASMPEFVCECGSPDCRRLITGNDRYKAVYGELLSTCFRLCQNAACQCISGAVLITFSMSNFEFTAKLWPYIKPYRWQVLFILLGLVVEFSYEASFRYSLKFLIDDVILKKNKEVFFLLFAIFGIVGVVYSVICVTCDYYWARYGAKIFSDLCHDLFQHLQKQPLEYHNRQSSGDLMARFTSDAGIVDTALVIVLPAAFLSTGELLVSSVFLFHLNSLLSFGVLLGIGISLYSPRLLIKKTALANYKLRDYNGRFSSFLQEHIGAFKIIQAYNLESHVTTKFREFLNDFVVIASKAYLLSYLSQRLPNLTFLILNMLIMFCGGLLVMQDQISVGTLVSYQVIFVSMSAAINQMTWIIPNMAAANAAMQRIQEVFDAPRAFRE